MNRWGFKKGLNAEVGCLDVLIIEQGLTCSLFGDLARFKHVSSSGNEKGLFHILLHDEDRFPLRIGCPILNPLFLRAGSRIKDDSTSCPFIFQKNPSILTI